MAGVPGKERVKFLSPAHFQASIGMAANSVDNKAVKLLPPTEYEGITERADLSRAVSETRKETDFDQLQKENKQLKDQLEKAREEELKLQEQYRRNKVLLQRSKVDDALDFKRMAETQEENMALQAEVHKQSAIIKKLRIEVKHVRSVFETDMAQFEAEAGKDSALIKHLKQELKQNETKYEAELDDLEKRCRKQTLLIKDLNSELEKARQQVQVDRKGFEDVISKSEYQKFEEVNKLEQCLKKSEERFSLQLGRLKDELVLKGELVSEMEKDMTSKSEELKCLKEEMKLKENKCVSEIRECEEQLQMSKVSFDQRTKELERVLNEESVSHKQAVDKLRRKLQQTQEELEVQMTEVSQLKAYIGKNLPDSQLERLKQENSDLKNDSHTLKHENTSLRTTVDLLNVRLSSISEILTIQDAELKKSLKAPENDSQGDNLITLWRQKVFALLVQLKSQEITQEREKGLENAQLKSLTQQLAETHKELAVLSHSVTDRNAELQIEVNKVRSLQVKLQECSATLQKQKAQLASHELAVQSFQQVSRSTESWIKSYGGVMEEALVKLASFSQRVNFASGRIKFLQGLFARREACWKQELADAVSQQTKEIEETQGPGTEAETVLSYQQLSAEVEQLTRERDLLVSQIQQDAKTLDERVSAIKEDYGIQLHDTKTQIAQLQSALKEEKERATVFYERSETAKENLREAEDTIEMLKTDLAKHKGTAEKAMDKAISKEQARFTEELANLEHQLNDVRREHTKAVVSLRQAERQVSREQEKAASQLAQEQKEYEAKLEKYKLQLVNMEREKNMLMATVRQEGLKVPRPTAQHYQSSSDESEKDKEKENRNRHQPGKRRSGKTTTATRRIPRNTRPSSRDNFTHLLTRKEEHREDCATSNPLGLDAMAHVLKDLQSLSTALLTVEKEPQGSVQHSLENN